jgi:Ca-activated chloride channel family protein
MNPSIRRVCQALAVVVLVLLTLFPVVSVLAQDEDIQIRITQVDNSKFPEVTVYVSATNAAGEPVGVDANKIQISENGKAMNTKYAGGSGEIGSLTTLLVMDVSGSMMQAGKLRSAKEAARAYVEQMRPGDQAGLVTFNTKVRYVQPLTTDLKKLTAAIDKLNAYEDTSMYDALAQGTQILKDVPGRKAIIVLTDGLDNLSKNTPDDVIEGIGPIGLSISTIGLGDPKKTGINSGLDEKGLRTFSERAGGIYSYANDPATLQGLYQLYARALQSEYRVVYTSPSTLRDGANRTLSVSLARASGVASSSVDVQYNPGGVLPEVAQSVSWPIFAAMLGGLLVLLFVPLTIGSLSKRQTSQPVRPVASPAATKKPSIKLK